jgi:hypothetical protein
MLNLSFCSDSPSLRTASLISPLTLQPELCPEGLREALTPLPPAHLVPPSYLGLGWGPVSVASTGPGKGSFLLHKPLCYLKYSLHMGYCLAPDLQGPPFLTFGTHKSGFD